MLGNPGAQLEDNIKWVSHIVILIKNDVESDWPASFASQSAEECSGDYLFNCENFGIHFIEWNNFKYDTLISKSM